MGRITWSLIRKKTEHHDGLLEDLEEISLHQLNIEKLDTIGRVCPRLKILYLQNNLIPRIENIKRLKSLVYLNLALNNVESISPEIAHCEKLRKLDLTVNFIDVDQLEPSLAALAPLVHLDELYLTGNPCTSVPGYRMFVVHMLPRLQKLDGSDISRGERLQAKAAYPAIAAEVSALAAQKRREKGLAAEEKARAEGSKAAAAAGKDDDDVAEEEEAAAAAAGTDGSSSSTSSTAAAYAAKCQQKSAYTPESRTAMHRENEEYERKKALETAKSREDTSAPDLWKDAQAKMNHKVLPEDLDALGPDQLPKQRNMGKWDFTISERMDDRGGGGGGGACVIVEIALQRFVDTSLVDVDVHPLWMQCIVKGKNLLLHFPREVNASATRVQRLQSTGALLLTCPVVKKISATTAAFAASDTKGKATRSSPLDDPDADAEEEAELAASEAASSTTVSTHNNVVDLTSASPVAGGRAAHAALSSSSSTAAASASASSSRAPAFAKASSGGGLNQVVSDYRHIAKKRTAEEVAARASIEAQLKEVAVTRSATLEEARLARQAQQAKDLHGAQTDEAESERAALERLGLDDTGVPDLE